MFSKFIVGASVIGPLHISHHLPNQDFFSFKKKKKYTVLVISDGMGSKPFADIGSKKACEAVEKSTAYFFDGGKKEIFSSEKFFEKIISSWTELVAPHDKKECSATCLFLLLTSKKVFTARLGDGMLCLVGKENGKSVLFTEEKGDNFSNVTHSLSDRGAEHLFSFSVYDRNQFSGVVMSTDGVSSDLKNDAEIPFAEDLMVETKKKFFRKHFLKRTMQNWTVPHHTDDKTILIASW